MANRPVRYRSDRCSHICSGPVKTRHWHRLRRQRSGPLTCPGDGGSRRRVRRHRVKVPGRHTDTPLYKQARMDVSYPCISDKTSESIFWGFRALSATWLYRADLRNQTHKVVSGVAPFRLDVIYPVLPEVDQGEAHPNLTRTASMFWLALRNPCTSLTPAIVTS